MAERSKADGNGANVPESPATQTAAEALDIAARGRISTASKDKTEAVAPVRTAADIVAATATRPVVKKTTAKKVAAKKTTAAVEPGRSRTTPAADNGFDRVRNLMASAVWLIAGLCAVVLALGALFTALSQTNDSNEIVTWVLARGAELVGPFGDLFKLETSKNTLLVNWGIAALAYLVVGKIAERVIRP